jgi:glycine/D-amino acid oxidase-like deaminating enzyme
MNSGTAIIIGGGVIGLSTAYHLARKRFGRIMVLEKDVVGEGSSSRAAGIITGLLWSEPGVLARCKSLQRFRELSEELDGYRFQDVGCLNLFDPASWPERQVLLPLYERLGVPFEILDAAEMRRRWPALHPAEDFTGLFDPLGGYSEPDQYVPALARRCRELGIDIRERQKVAGFLTSNGRVTGVRSNGRDLEGDAVVCTTHAWTAAVVEPLGWQLPVKNFVHQRYITRPLAGPVPIPAINANPLGGYVRPATGDRLLLGIETPEREEWRVTTSDFHMSALSAATELRDTLRNTFRPLLPALGETTWEGERVGLIAFAMDGEPVLGPVGRLPGLFVGCAFHSGGFAYNPVAGLLLAEYITDGRTALDVTAFSPDRFDPDQVDSYLAATVPQKAAVRRRH